LQRVIKGRGEMPTWVVEGGKKSSMIMMDIKSLVLKYNIGKIDPGVKTSMSGSAGFPR
jgi:hypothetical protein